MSRASALEAVWTILAGVSDPEIPVLSLVDLGVIREVHVDGRVVRVGVAPTYSGCPATLAIKADLTTALQRAGYRPDLYDVLSPPWSTDWITPHGREQLRAYGIAPPEPIEDRPALCPRCASGNTELLSEFGSTPCKALHRCLDCLEPFDRFKCI